MFAGDIPSNPGPESNQNNAFRCLSFNAQSLKSVNKNEDGTVTSNIRNFQDLVYSENLDIITITETWLNDTISNNELLPIQYNTVTLNDHPNLEIVAVELDTKNSKCLLSVCYRLFYNLANTI
jgi:hypothetical protein